MYTRTHIIRPLCPWSVSHTLQGSELILLEPFLHLDGWLSIFKLYAEVTVNQYTQTKEI
jgi:hypothetical protein